MAAERTPTRRERLRPGEGVGVAALMVLGVVAIGVAGWSLRQGGIGWDARFDTGAATAVREVETSWSLKRAYAYVPVTSEFYGVLPHQLADGLRGAFASSSAADPADDPTTYTYQGFVALLLAVTSVTALGIAIAIAVRSWLAGAFAWSLTLSTPLWLGLSHVDLKDAPLAAGLTYVSAGLMLGLTLGSLRKRIIVATVLIGAGSVVALGTRPGALGLLFALVAGTVVAALGSDHANRRRRDTPPGPGAGPREVAPTGGRRAPALLVASAAGLASGLGTAWATNPVARIDFVTWLSDALEVASLYPVVITVRVLGQDVESINLPWWYVPVWLGGQLPLLSLLALALGVGGLVFAAIKSRSEDVSGVLVGIPIVFQGVVLPLFIIASGSALYDGLRHLLFMLPGLLAIPALGLAVTLRHLAGRWQRAFTAAAVVCVAGSLLASLSWAPYAYAHVNPLVRSDPHRQTWDLDFWGVSAREGVNRLRSRGLQEITVLPANDVGVPWGANGRQSTRRSWGLFVFRRFDTEILRNCVVVFQITRGGHVLGEGAECAPHRRPPIPIRPAIGGATGV